MVRGRDSADGGCDHVEQSGDHLQHHRGNGDGPWSNGYGPQHHGHAPRYSLHRPCYHGYGPCDQSNGLRNQFFLLPFMGGPGFCRAANWSQLSPGSFFSHQAACGAAPQKLSPPRHQLRLKKFPRKTFQTPLTLTSAGIVQGRSVVTTGTIGGPFGKRSWRF
jgi:hypothetical protein